MKALVTGISGFVGSAVATELLSAGHEVVGFAREPARVKLDVPVVAGDAVSGDGVEIAMRGVDVAYYLIHSIERGRGTPAERDLRAARHFAGTARAHGVGRVIYLGTFAPAGGRSHHATNRLRVEDVIRTATPDSVALRAGLVIGSRCRPLRMFTRMVERSPVVPLGRWRDNRTATIDAGDVARYLVAAATDEEMAGRSLDLPGAEVVTYGELVRRLAAAIGRRRAVVPLPLGAQGVCVPLAAAVAGEPRQFAGSIMSMLVGDLLPDPRRLAAPSGAPLRPLDDSLRAMLA